MDILGAFDRVTKDWGGGLKAFLEEGYHPAQIDSAPMAGKDLQFQFGPGGEFFNRPAPQGYARDAEGWLREVGDAPKLDPFSRFAGYFSGAFANDPTIKGAKAMHIASALGGTPDPSMAGMWAGAKARTAPRETLAKAVDMKEKGHQKIVDTIDKNYGLGSPSSPESINDIWRMTQELNSQTKSKTGWQRGLDSKYRWEIPDHARIVQALGADPKKMGDFLDHPALYEAYPQLRDINVKSMLPGPDNIAGSWHKDTNTIKLAGQQNLSTTLHELQHAIQDIEGFGKGGNPYEFMRANVPQDLKNETQFIKVMTEAPDIQQKYRDWRAAQGLPEGKPYPAYPRDIEIALSTLANAVEQKKGWYLLPDSFSATGADSARKALDTMPEELKLLYHAINNQKRLTKEADAATKRYRNLHGEAEARDTQVRQSLSPSLRKVSPMFSHGHLENINPLDLEIRY